MHNASQETVFSTTATDVVTAALDGYNGIFWLLFFLPFLNINVLLLLHPSNGCLFQINLWVVWLHPDLFSNCTQGGMLSFLLKSSRWSPISFMCNHSLLISPWSRWHLWHFSCSPSSSPRFQFLSLTGDFLHKTRLVYHTVPSRQAEYYDRGCLSVCVRNHTSKLHQIICACYLWPWLAVDGVAVCYVLSVLWMTSCFHILWAKGRHVANAAVLSAWTNAPAAWYWLHPVLDDSMCQDLTSPSCTGYWERSLLSVIA